MMNSTNLASYNWAPIGVGGPPGSGWSPTFVPKPYMVYILESCLSGSCEPFLREVPITDSVSLSKYGVHIVAGYSVIQETPGYGYDSAPVPVSVPAPGITSSILAIGYNEPTKELHPNSDGQLSGSRKEGNNSRPRGKKVTHSDLMALLSLASTPAENPGLQTREKSKKKPARRQRGTSKVKQTDAKPVHHSMSVYSGNPTHDRNQNFPEEVELQDVVVDEPTKSKGAIDIVPRRHQQGYKHQCCKFCKGNGEKFSTYSNHNLKNENNETVCPVLRKYICPNCKKTGDEAHTLRYCPDVKSSNDGAGQVEGRGPFKNSTRLYSSIRNSVGGRKILRY